jgi:cytosine/adenosine deaminase-related metal-dependent hydrolase
MATTKRKAKGPEDAKDDAKEAPPAATKAERRLALTGGLLLELAPARLRRGAILVENDRIAAISDDAPSGWPTLDCAGLVLMPGLVDAHVRLGEDLIATLPARSDGRAPTHLGRLAEGAFRVDRAFDHAALARTARSLGAAALAAGTTTIFVQVSAPSAIEGALDVVADALEATGIRAAVAYATAERPDAAAPRDEARAAVRETDRFLARLTKNPRPRIAGLVGAHAAHLLSAEIAEALADVAARREVATHLRAGEASVDSERDGIPTVAWLEARGLLRAGSILASGAHLEGGDAARLLQSGAYVAHTPRSDLRDGDAPLRPARFGDRLVLGTGGETPDLRWEAHLAALVSGAPRLAAAALDRGRALAAWTFGRDFALGVGAVADLIALRWPESPSIESIAALPADAQAAAVSELLHRAEVAHVLVDGNVVRGPA